MNYKNIYDQFIADRRIKEATLTGYSEKHHIIPRSLGGDDSPENLIKLTAGDHYFAHLLLAHSYGGRQWSGVYSMAKLHSKNHKRVYFLRRFVEKAREQSLGVNNPSKMPHVKEMRRKFLLENPMPISDKKGKNNPMYGVRLVGEKNGMFGRKQTPEWKAARSLERSGLNHPNSDKTIYKFKNLKTGEIVEKTKFEMRKFASIGSTNIVRMIRGDNKTAMGWTLA
jgi:hypothetical protein